MEGLTGRHRGRRPWKLTARVRARVLAATRRPPPDGTTHWSCRTTPTRFCLRTHRLHRPVPRRYQRKSSKISNRCSSSTMNLPSSRVTTPMTVASGPRRPASSPGSTRGIVENPRQEQFRCLERLPGASVAQFGIRQQVRSDGKVVVGPHRLSQGARWLDDQQVSATSSRLGDERLLGFAVLKRTDRRVNLRLLRAKVGLASLGRIGSCQRPGLATLGEHSPQPQPDLLFLLAPHLNRRSFSLGRSPSM